MTEKPETAQNSIMISGDANVRIGALAQGDNATASYWQDRGWEPSGRERDELQARRPSARKWRRSPSNCSGNNRIEGG